MGKFMRKCKGIGEVAVMEVQVSHHQQVGARTRARTKILAATRRRKLSCQNITTLQNSDNNVVVSRCSTSASLRSVIDLVDEECNELENSSYSERTPSSELHHLHFKAIDLDSSTESPSSSPEEDSRHNSTMPTESEIEDFFVVAEEDEKKRFEAKYNYNINKDVPLDGRFEWVPLTP